MKILGHKFFGQDSAIFYLDTEKKEIFALNADRVSRIKKDNYDISPILDRFRERFNDIDEVAYSFATFDGRDAVLETKGTSYYWLNWQRLLRRITKPRYRSDILRKKARPEKIATFFKSMFLPKIFYYKIARDYYWRKYLKDILPQGFHKKRIDRYIKETLNRYGIRPKHVCYFDHHLCHAATAYYMSPFAYSEKVLVFTLDEHGDECFSALYHFENQNFTELAKSQTAKFFIGNQVFVKSIAGMYSNFTEAMDLVRSTDEGKVEALAAYGKVDGPTFGQLMQMVRVENLEFKIDVEKYKKFSDMGYLKEIRKRIGDQNFCATIQHWLEEVVVLYLNQAHKKYKINNLCIAGGAAANVIMNLKIYDKTPFKQVFVVPFMGDEGSAAGAAILSALKAQEDIRWLKNVTMPYFGPEYPREKVLDAIKKFKEFRHEFLGDQWYLQAAKSISENKVIGVFQGRMEFGPRALGNRSILANAADKDARDKLNSKIKRRPYYQPFCPSILEEDREALFERSFKHKHMAIAFSMKSEFRDKFSSAMHIDLTARPQFVEESDNPNFYKLLKEVKRYLGYGIVINTSFNLHGRTIVNTPFDAITDFRDCSIDELFIEGYRLLRK